MSGPRSWKPLPLAVPGIPNLLVSTDFTPQSYTIRITDLANVWTECLEKKPIIMRGLKEDTSIDPTDGPDQIRKLLELLRAAFDPSSPEHGDTSMVLSSGGSGEGDNVLSIHVTVILPGGLRPLKWPMYLTWSPPSAIATELVLPLVQAHHARTQEITEMVATLRDKDGVIAKLVDKLEATGTGLEHIFTSLSGRRKLTRTIAEERVKGLAPFREADFRKRSVAAHVEAGPGDIQELLDNVFGGTGLACAADLEIEDSPALNNWWTKLGKGKHIALVERGKETAKRTETPPPPVRTESKSNNNDRVDGSGDSDDDDFQVQITPPSLATGKRDTSTRPRTVNAAPAAPAATNDDDDETSDGEDVEIPDSMPVPSQRTRTGADARPSGARLGVIGKRANPPPPPRSASPPPSSPAVHVNKGDDDGSVTASDVDDADNDASSPEKPPPPRAAQPRRPALGRIGGKATARARTPPVSIPDETSAAPATTTTPKRSRLGAIGRKTGVGEEAETKRGRGTTPTLAKEEEIEVEERRRETSQERADRKREELQRELQKRAGAGPAKKKRKF